MKSLIALICVISFSFYTDSLSKGKSLSGEIPKGNRIVDGVQYIAKGSPYLDLYQASIVAELDPSDHSITLYAPLIAPPESLYIRFIPSSLFSASLSAGASWDAQTQAYSYQYSITSDSGSVTPIGHLEIEWWNDYKRVFVPRGWIGGRVLSRRVNYWSDILYARICAGDSLSGIGYESYGPPVLTKFELWGELKVLDAKGSDEMFGSIYSGISEKFRGVKGITIAAWVSPESIEPVDWFMRVCTGVPILKNSGYLDRQIQSAIYPSLYALQEEFQLKESQSLDKLGQEINTALAALEPYHNQMEPEAWAFITENLKYVLRHLDIVTFKEYP